MNHPENLSLSAIPGQVRVTIERVSPELDGGQFPIKAIPGDVIAVEADILADGHDYLSAKLLYKHKDDADWSEMTMALLVNDRWGASFIVEKQGRYLYTIEAWVNHPASWQHEIHLKVADGQRITSELQAGAYYLDGMFLRAGMKLASAKGKGKKKKRRLRSRPTLTHYAIWPPSSGTVPP